MRESSNNAALIKNMIQTVRGEYPLWRTFGLDETDSPSRLTRGTIQSEASRWYPEVIVAITTATVEANGHFEYDIEVK